MLAQLAALSIYSPDPNTRVQSPISNPKKKAHTHTNTLYINKHYDHINLFISIFDTQLHQFNSSFCDNMIELLTLVQF